MFCIFYISGILQVLGDSTLLMDWEIGLCQISNLNIGPIMHIVLELSNIFYFISFKHIYREFNTKVDLLSKDALSLQKGILEAQEFRGEDHFVVSSISIFFNLWKGYNLKVGRRVQSLAC
jgi:hypothetical protein